MKAKVDELLLKHNLPRIKPLVNEFMLPCLYFDLVEGEIPTDRLVSKVGGNPFLPSDFRWPHDKGRPLDFLLQVDLSEILPYDATRALPAKGCLSFFYDLENQPWCYDPSDLGGFYVHLATDHSNMREISAQESEYALHERLIIFRSGVSVPAIGSIAYDDFERKANFVDDEFERYCDFSIDLSLTGSSYKRDFYGGIHQIFGHSQNVQGDMQLEAQLVSNGLYCGDSSGYNDPKAELLRGGAQDWILLLQLDTDEHADLMWGDVGMLYFWIRKPDLDVCRFDKVWMTLQCG